MLGHGVLPGEHIRGKEAFNLVAYLISAYSRFENYLFNLK
jgi:hypothetical protein